MDSNVTATETAAGAFLKALQDEPDVNHAFNVLALTVCFALEGNSIAAKMDFLKVLGKGTGVTDAVKQSYRVAAANPGSQALN
jgi:hypothetical protein